MTSLGTGGLRLVTFSNAFPNLTYYCTHTLLRFLLPFHPPPTHTHTMETVALYDYEKQDDDELSLKEGDVITDVEQVCALLSS